MTLRLNGDGSGFTEIKAADTAGDNSIKLPAGNGSANELLQNGGTAGELQYTSAGGGLHYDSSGRLLVGASSDLAPDGFASKIQAAALDYTSSISLRREGDNASGTVLNFVKTRSTSLGGNTAVQDGDMLGGINFYGADGADANSSGGYIRCLVEGAPSTDVLPAKIVFYTNAGSASPTPRMEIGSNGALKLLNGCPGIDFSGISSTALAGTTVDNNLLDDYEEGTWTPNVGGTATYQKQKGSYIKIGRFVHVTFYITINAIGTGNTNTILGLPFSGDAYTGGGAIAYWANTASNYVYLSVYNYNSSGLNFYGITTGSSDLAATNPLQNNATVQGSLVYRTQ